MEIYPQAALEMSFHTLEELIWVLMKSKPETGPTFTIHPQFVAYRPSAPVGFPHFLLYLVPLVHFLHQMRVSIQDTLAPSRRWSPFKSDLGYSLTME